MEITANLHKMQIPREVWVGDNILTKISELCLSVGFKKGAVTVLVEGEKTKHVAGNTVAESLKSYGFEVHRVSINKADSENMEKTSNLIQEVKATFAIGVGGGKNIDVAKVASVKNKIPFISVPTIASHDGITSPRASIKNNGKPYSIQAQAPMAILADIETISKSPFRFTAAGCGDLLSNFTAIKDWILSHKLRGEYYGAYAASLSLTSASHIVENAELIGSKNKEGVRIVVEGLIGSGVAMAIAGNSRPASGSEHLFSHALDTIAKKPALHGEQCGIGTIMMMYLHGGDWKKIRQTLTKIGAPTTAKQLGIDEDTIIEALCQAHKIRPERYTILGEKGLTKTAAKELAEKTLII